jgi:hypothetical protein
MAKRQDGVEVHIGQYFLLSSYFDHLKKADPDGTFMEGTAKLNPHGYS